MSYDMNYDAIVIGGGFYGCSVALLLADIYPRIALVEKEDELMGHASFNNQARVHHGYHYPRSLGTGQSSRLNYSRFLKEFENCIDRSFHHYYAISRHRSKTTAPQFESFCKHLGAPLRPAPAAISQLFDPRHVSAVYEVEEVAFDSFKLRDMLRDRLTEKKIDVYLDTAFLGIEAVTSQRYAIALGRPGIPSIQASTPLLFNCTYSSLNLNSHKAGARLIPLRHELTEIALIEVPPALKDKAFTVMCGPFFSTMPFPPLGYHSLSHVTYTPHYSWEDRDEATDFAIPPEPRSNVTEMLHDAQRYLPYLGESRYVKSLWEIKTVLPQGELNDSRPILVRRDSERPGFISVLGGKIDNIYDLASEIRQMVRP